jgi:hypothetical protein
MSLGWVAVEPKPAPFIKDFIDAAQFYTFVALLRSRHLTFAVTE